MLKNKENNSWGENSKDRKGPADRIGHKKAKELGLYPQITKNGKEPIDASSLEEFHNLWKVYQFSLLQNLLDKLKNLSSGRKQINGGAVQRYMFHYLDLHGAKISVSHSSNEANEGLEGIVVRESENALLICSSKNSKIKLIPKQCASFHVDLDFPELLVPDYQLAVCRPVAPGKVIIGVIFHGPSLCGCGRANLSAEAAYRNKAVSNACLSIDLRKHRGHR